MRIVDAHTHLPGGLLGARPRPVAAIREELAAGGVAQAWMFTTDGLIRDTERQNDVLAEALRDELDFFVPFCTVDPHRGADAACRELERASHDLGMRGLKLHPWLQSFSMTNPSVLPIFRRASELGLPVILHDGSPPYSCPLQIAWVAERVPEATVILGHGGLDDMVDEAIRACLRRPNVHLCLCGPSCGSIEEIVARVPLDRLLFGSDGGYASGVVEHYVDRMRAAIPSEETLARIFWENPRRIVS
jgi:uncharacterized protein